MTQPATEPTACEALTTRTALILEVRDQFRGSGLEIRELETRLAISDPGHPEHGRIYITYLTGDVTHRRTTWDYLGHFDGRNPEPGDPDAEPTIPAAAILALLSPPPPPEDQPPEDRP